MKYSLSIEDKKTKFILITGCASGIGKYLAHALAKDGWPVISTDKVAGKGIIHLDLTDSKSIEFAVARVKDISEGRLYGLINNAGVAYAGKIEDLSRESLRQQFEVNVFGTHELTRLILPMLYKNDGGRIINIGSINGKISFPMMGAYSASKFALEALTDALRHELAGTNIKVSLIEPGSITSNFRNNAVCFNCELGEKPGRSPDIVFRKVRHALESKNAKTRYLAGNASIIYLRRLLPDSLFDRLIKNIKATG